MDIVVIIEFEAGIGNVDRYVVRRYVEVTLRRCSMKQA